MYSTINMHLSFSGPAAGVCAATGASGRERNAAEFHLVREAQ